jgi:micrococcal nuclease
MRQKIMDEEGKLMSFVKLVVAGMLGAFSVGAGLSYVAIGQNSSQTAVQVPQPASSKTVHAKFRPYSLCSGSIRFHCVVDGDTLWHEGLKIRVADIDAPEVGSPKCSSEAALGARSTNRLLQLVNQGPFQILSWKGRDEDRYGRKLRVLVRNGRSLGDTLVAEGLARTWSGRRQPWC